MPITLGDAPNAPNLDRSNAPPSTRQTHKPDANPGRRYEVTVLVILWLKNLEARAAMPMPLKLPAASATGQSHSATATVLGTCAHCSADAAAVAAVAPAGCTACRRSMWVDQRIDRGNEPVPPRSHHLTPQDLLPPQVITCKLSFSTWETHCIILAETGNSRIDWSGINTKT